MKKNTPITALIIFAIGIVMILVATLYGTMVAGATLQSYGGTNLDEYHLLIRTNALSFQIIGAILSSLSGLGILCSLYLKKDNSISE